MSLPWRGVTLAGLQMCRRCVGQARFPLSKTQRLMATGQRSATGSDLGQSLKFIWVSFVLSSGDFVSILLLLPSSSRGAGHTGLMDHSSKAFNSGGGGVVIDGEEQSFLLKPPVLSQLN